MLDANQLALAEAGLYAQALTQIEREVDQYRGAKALRENITHILAVTRREVAKLVE